MERTNLAFDMWSDQFRLTDVLKEIISSRDEARPTGCPQEPIAANSQGGQGAVETPADALQGTSQEAQGSAAVQLTSSSRKPSRVRRKVCGFCKQNGETVEVYSSHIVRDSQDKVCCPFLRKYICPVCGATGDKAHTKRFCPKIRSTYVCVYLNKP
ncbi:nanos homolog 2-like [Polypterus senegalus]